MSILSTILIFTLNIPITKAALTATTANTIQGSAPSFAATSGEKKLGFKINDTLYSEQTGNITSGTAKVFAPSLRFNDFVVQNLTASDFDVSTDYADNDGDSADPTTPFTIGAMSYEWKDASNTIISGSALNNKIGCGSSYTMPYTLTITANNAQVHSQYGDPKDSALTMLTQSYLIDAQSGICSLKPNSLDWWGYDGSYGTRNGGSATVHATYGGGYNADFDPSNGFNPTPTVAVGKTFPTTGFAGAQFTMVMSGGQSAYTYSEPSGYGTSVVTVSNTGLITLKSKPSGTITIRATLIADSSVYHDYRFNPTTAWAIPKGTTKYSRSDAISLCGGSLFSVAELTNSPAKSVISSSWSFYITAMTRSIGESLFSEWGWTQGISYPNSLWNNNNTTNANWYWAIDVYGSKLFLVNSGDNFSSGRIEGRDYSGSSYYAVCKG